MYNKLLLLAASVWTLSATAGVVYDSIPAPLPPNVSSLGYEATSTRELGNAVNLGPGSRQLTGITVVMSNWAKESTYEAIGASAGFQVPLTLNLYNPGPSGSVGSNFSSLTINAFIPWRPEHDASCAGDAYLAADNGCYNGIAAEVIFDYSNQFVTLPDSLIFGLAFNTEHNGYSPTGIAGPWNSLNFGVQGAPSVGTNVDGDIAYWNTTHAGFYSDNGAGGVGTFRADTGWAGFSPEIRIDVVPEPAYGGLILLVVVSGWYLRRARRDPTRNNQAS